VPDVRIWPFSRHLVLHRTCLLLTQSGIRLALNDYRLSL